MYPPRCARGRRVDCLPGEGGGGTAEGAFETLPISLETLSISLDVLPSPLETFPISLETFPSFHVGGVERFEGVLVDHEPR